MNEYMFYTSEGYTYPPIEDKTIDNCQLLGTAWGKNEEDAKKKLEENSPWIKDGGYDIKKVVSKQLLSEETKKDINMLLQYLKDLSRHYQQKEKTDCQMHEVLLRLKELID